MSSIAIVGKSGTGKSTSYGEFPELGIKGLNPKETIVINVSSKDLPFRGWKKLYKGKISEGGNYFESSDADQISKVIHYVKNNRTDIKNIVIDDAQYLLAFEYMRRAKENGYNKYVDMGVNTNKVIEAARLVGNDLKVFFLWHPEIDKDGTYKFKTVGKIVPTLNLSN